MATTSTKRKVSKKPVRKPLRQLRFLPDPSTLAELGVRVAPDETRTFFGLVLNESQSGCAVVLVTAEKLTAGLNCICRIGKFNDRYAEIKWVKPIEKNLIKLGLNYTDD